MRRTSSNPSRPRPTMLPLFRAGSIGRVLGAPLPEALREGSGRVGKGARLREQKCIETVETGRDLRGAIHVALKVQS
jgi:hypothetical protein